jgi:hypothetical protein
MNPPDNTRDLGPLRRLWHRWVPVVELFALRRRGRRRVTPRGYQALYEELLAACRAHGETARNGDRAYYDGLEGLVRPWLNLRAFEKADRDILFDLLERCREADRRMGGSGGRFTGSGWWAVPLYAGAAGGLLLSGFWGLRWLAGNAWDADWLRPLWLAVKNSTTAERLSAVGGVVALFTILMVVRLGRRW